MALHSDVKKQQKAEELEELLNALEKLLDRTKVLFEQYFMGIQKVAPMQLHRDIERRVRDLTQHQIRNTGLRFRFATLSQKFGAYNTYWKRTLREIEQGKYVRDLARVKRKAEQAGEELPEELLVKLPKLVQDRIRRDRALLAERADHDAERISKKEKAGATESAESDDDEPIELRQRVHHIEEEEAEHLFGEEDLDLDGLFGALTSGEEAAAEAAAPRRGSRTAPPRTAPPPAAPPRTAPPPAAAPSPGAKPPGPAPWRSTIQMSVVPPPIPRSVADALARPASASPGFKVPLPGGRAARPVSEPAASVPAPPAPAPPAPAAARAPAPPPEPAPAPAQQPRRPAPRPVVAAVAPPPGMDEKQCRELFTRYVKARQLVGEKTDDITYEKLVSTLHKQAPQIMKDHGARGVQFHVVVKGDRVVLKAKPVK